MVSQLDQCSLCFGSWLDHARLFSRVVYERSWNICVQIWSLRWGKNLFISTNYHCKVTVNMEIHKIGLCFVFLSFVFLFHSSVEQFREVFRELNRCMSFSNESFQAGTLPCLIEEHKYCKKLWTTWLVFWQGVVLLVFLSRLLLLLFFSSTYNYFDLFMPFSLCNLLCSYPRNKM